ncbi:MAG: hypothetical protein ACMV1B_09095 [Prevotella sp.]
MKLNIKLENNWLEATWLEDEMQIHCESFSGHREHIAQLRAKAKEFNTPLIEFESLIKQCQDSFVYPTDEEIAKEQLEHKINEAKAYLLSTDYKMTIDYFATLSKEVQDELIAKRVEAREFVRLNEGAK